MLQNANICSFFQDLRNILYLIKKYIFALSIKSATGCEFKTENTTIYRLKSSEIGCSMVCQAWRDCTHYMWSIDTCALKKGPIMAELAVKSSKNLVWC